MTETAVRDAFASVAFSGSAMRPLLLATIAIIALGPGGCRTIDNALYTGSIAPGRLGRPGTLASSPPALPAPLGFLNRAVRLRLLIVLGCRPRARPISFSRYPYGMWALASSSSI